MIMMGLKFTDKVPFKEIYITGLIRDEHGQKMSKSKGNVLDPIDIIDGIELDTLIKKRTTGMMNPQDAEKISKRTREQYPDGINSYGTDALRFTFCAMASTSRDINFDLHRVEGYRNFCNKLWNAARFVLMNVESDAHLTAEKEYGVADRWITSRFQKTITSFEDNLKIYRFDLCAQGLYEFVWNEYCDWYLELAKPILYSDTTSNAQKMGTTDTLIKVLDQILRLLHPFMPFITEEIWQSVRSLSSIEDVEGDLIVQAFPQADSSLVDAEADSTIALIKDIVVGIRTIRAEMNIAPSKPLPVIFANGSDDDRLHIQQQENYLAKLAKLESITWLAEGDTPPAAATALAGNVEILIPMAGLIDKDAELERLQKELDKLLNEQKRLTGKLSNEGFVAKAPEAVVAKERNRLAEVDSALEKLQEKQQQIKDI